MTNSKPLVSVIVPLYNRRQFLPQLFATLKAQTFQNFELILIDDGSTDKTDEWIDENKSSLNNPIVYQKQANAGPYVARNQGVKVASGQYIAFQDSDDEWPPYHLADFVEVLDANPDIDWVFGSLKRIDHQTRETVEATNFSDSAGSVHPFTQLKSIERDNQLQVINDNRAGEIAIKFAVPGSTQCALIQARVFDSNLFDESFRTAYDRFFAIKLVLQGYQFAFVEKTHQIYHIHDGHISLVAGASDKKLEASAKTMLRGYTSLYQLATKESEKLAIKHRLAEVYAWELGISLLGQRAYLSALKCYMQAVKLNPFQWTYYKASIATLLKLIVSPVRKGMK